MAYRHPAAFLLGLEGLALLRAFAGEFDAAFVSARLAETRDILAAAEHGELGSSPDMLAYARRTAPGVAFVHGDLRGLPCRTPPSTSSPARWH